jgi:hypothetical protein
MRRFSACLVVVVASVVQACGFPDYGFDRGAGGFDGRSVDAGRDARPDVSVSSGGGGGRMGGSGGGNPADTGPDVEKRCSVDGECVGSPTGSLCDPTDGVCVECRLDRADCPPGTRCTPARLCEPGCAADRDCVGVVSLFWDAGSGGGVVDGGPKDGSAGGHADAARDAAARDGGGGSCDLVTHTCAGCRLDDECPSGSLCDAKTRHCVPGCNPGRLCPQGFTCCAGACENLLRSSSHCGSCSLSCEREGGLGACINGSCQPGACRPGFGDCNGDPRDGCEVDLGIDPDHCGACKAACPTPITASRPRCVSGTCALGPCEPGFANCDGDPVNACEVNLGLNTLNCGTCGFACNLLNANQRCEASACAITTCHAGSADCDKITSTGCEVNTQSDPSNCGACGKVCAFANADAKCQSGACRIASCLAGTADCNGEPVDGCEVHTNSDVANCGSSAFACARPCALAHATPTCTDGACEIAKCDQGFGDCDGQVANGCETNLDTSVVNCSACGKACSQNHGTAACALGACSVNCAGGFADCDVDPSNGCETNTSSNVEHCGGCPNVCSTSGGTPNCVVGRCGLSTCGGTLADCNASPADGCEINTATSVNNCGGCGKVCFVPNGSPTCTGSSCAISSCTPGFANCNTDVDDGCETRLNTLAQCGGCNTACALPHANASCVTGTCEVASCITPYVDCDGVASNGCEVDTSKDTNNCGGCGDACDATNGTPKCLNGSCAITCNAGFANCNAAVSDGCEKETKNDVANCGACGVVCAVQNGTPACNGTTCAVASCMAPFADCDRLYATGCESNTDTRINNCGICGKVCDTSGGTPTCEAGVCVTP